METACAKRFGAWWIKPSCSPCLDGRDPFSCHCDFFLLIHCFSAIATLTWKQLFSLPGVALMRSPYIYFLSSVGWLDQLDSPVLSHEADSPKRHSSPASSLCPDGIMRQSPVKAGTPMHHCLELSTGQSSLHQQPGQYSSPPALTAISLWPAGGSEGTAGWHWEWWL